jgi:endonuclease/exonuclease/phosphatase family metal-dependent hydrolase
MGQSIEVEATVIDDIAHFDTDRALTGQDGISFSSADGLDGSTFPSRLAQRLFAEVPAIDHVFVASNQVVVRRPHGWDDHVVAEASRVISGFFLFY